ncbi:glycosyltransferase [Pseudoalteromonas sp. NZS127_1]|uniref:ATP-grasp fold amidoligase family protein n=1 Tax=Pseudoalteromonas sp. NZS127_1 TaxID=2792074 RepID=UPI0003FA3DF6|nr:MULTISPECIES: ATP-grasp fold amidoligase family protein [unclassified Pseudoalteromonas]MBG9994717.1 glycosyltransferase [Pseudoalteromonas sp. NZS127_1]
MSIIRKIRSNLYSNSNLLRRCWFYLSFYRRNGYFLTALNPTTFNEKVHIRKSNPSNPLFSICSDKLAVKTWITEKGLAEIVIETYYSGKIITYDTLKNIIHENGDVLLKANHNSGPVYLLTESCSDEKIKYACDDVNKQLKVDYGKLKNEPWYSDIPPSILVEKRLLPHLGESSLRDYKFHVFKQSNGDMKTILHIDFDRDEAHHRSFFDEKLNWIPITSIYPSIITKIERPKNFDTMLELAKNLAKDFSYARVDFYNVDGKIYFGELTFAHESGDAGFNSYAYDKWLGDLWQQDPRM